MSEIEAIEYEHYIDSIRTVLAEAFTPQLQIFSLEFPRNVIEAFAQKKFFGLHDLYEIRGQYYALREFYQCYCPICATFTPDDVFNIPLDDLMNDALLIWNWDTHVEYCPHCGLTKQELITDKLLKSYNTMLAVIGMRAGKTTMVAGMLAWTELFMISLGDARRALGLEKAPFLEIDRKSVV